MELENSQIELLNLLSLKFNEAKEKNPQYSMRAFARKLDISAPELSLILRHKRQVSYKMAQKILRNLSIDSNIKNDILKEFPRALKRTKRSIQNSIEVRENFNNHTQLSQDEFSLVSDWYFFAIMSLIETQDFVSDYNWIANRLGVKVKNIVNAIDTLIRLGLIIQDQNNNWIPSGKEFKTSTDIPSACIKKNHTQGLEMALDSIYETPIELRDMGSTTIAVNLNLLPEAKKRIRELRAEITKILSSGEKTEVYRLSTQLIPVSSRNLGEI